MAKKQKMLKTEGDFFFLILIVCIAIFGTIMIYSASYYHSISKNGNPYDFMQSDLLYKALGFVAFFFLANYDYHRLGKYSVIIMGAGYLLLGLIFTPIGVTINNSTRWLDFKVMTVMPGEVIKTCFILFLAWYLSTDSSRVRSLKGLAVVGGLAGLAFLLVYLQPSLTTAGTILLLILAILIVAGLPKKIILLGVVGGAMGFAGLTVVKGAGYMYDRVRIALDPWSDTLGEGYQVVQSLLALGSGGVLGVGLGKSIQKTLYLPEPENDYILAIIGEELGYVGVIILMAVYVLILWRIFRIAVRARDSYGMLLASGVGLHIAIHVIMNIAIVSATFPPTGIVLPFVTAGGNATMLFLAECGIVFNVSRYPAEQLVPDNALPAVGGA